MIRSLAAIELILADIQSRLEVMLVPNDGHVIQELKRINGKQAIESGDSRREGLIALDVHPWQEKAGHAGWQTQLLRPGASERSAVAGEMLPRQACSEVINPRRGEGMNIGQVD